MSNQKSSEAVLSTLEWISDNDFIPVPLHYGKKEMCDGTVFQPDYNPNVKRWHEENLNIGVITGPARKGPIDLDLDSLEAIKLAPFFIPPSEAIFGHADKPRSHYLYQIEDDWKKYADKDGNLTTIKFLDPSSNKVSIGNPTLLEIRADHSQTMMPGSIHPKNNRQIMWAKAKFPRLKVVSFGAIFENCKLLAVASLIARYAWIDGQRHDTAMQLAGIFRKLNKSQEETENFINALIAYSGEDDPSHLATVRTTYQRSANDKSIKSVKSFLDRFKDVNPIMARTVLALLGIQDSWVDDINEKYACVMIGSKHRIAQLAQRPNDPILFLQADDFHAKLGNKFVTTQSGKQRKLSDLWLQHPVRTEYERTEFLPGIPQEKMEAGTLNKFTGWNVQPMNNPSGCVAFRELLENYITNPEKPEEAEWLYAFFAHILREPMDKQRAAAVIIGQQNVGKSIFVNYFGRILGRYHLNVADATRIYGRFNGHLEQCLLLHSEEAIYAGDKKHKSVIKDLISNKLISYEEKYLGTWTGRSYTRIIYTSNDDNAAPLEIMDTRHSIFNMKQGKRVPPRELTAQLYEEALANGPACLMGYLLNMPNYSATTLHKSIINEAKSTALTYSFDPLDDYWYNKLMTGELLPDYLRWAQDNHKLKNDAKKLISWPSQVSRLALYADYKEYIIGMRRVPISSTAFFRQVEKWLSSISVTFKLVIYYNPYTSDYSKPNWVREMYSGKHQTLLNFPDLAQAREDFEQYTGQRFKWPEIEEEPKLTIVPSGDDELKEEKVNY